VRPVTDSKKWSPDAAMAEQTYTVECQQGDMIMLNTSLWWHQTAIPCTKTAKDNLSLSYAMDFHINREGEQANATSDMTNIESLYAMKDISEGDFVLTEP